MSRVGEDHFEIAVAGGAAAVLGRARSGTVHAVRIVKPGCGWDPEVMGSGSLTTYVPMYHSAFDHRQLSISVEQAQTIVCDAVTYARGLGFEPAAGFIDASVHLGTPPADRPTIGFGRDGKPFYFSGPYDDPRKVVQTLERTCGPGNYDYVAHL